MGRLHFDIWVSDREKAVVLETGVRVLRDTNGARFIAAMWMPKATKPVGDTRYWFTTEEKREKWINDRLASFEAHQKEKAERRKASVEGDLTLADPGAVFCYSWGYDQTNIDYFEVVERSGQMVTIAEIAAETVPGSEGMMCSHVRPRPGAFVVKCKECGCSKYGNAHRPDYGEGYHEYQPDRVTQKKRIRFYRGEPCISFSCGTGFLVKVHRFGNADPLVLETQYTSSYH